MHQCSSQCDELTVSPTFKVVMEHTKQDGPKIRGEWRARCNISFVRPCRWEIVGRGLSRYVDTTRMFWNFDDKEQSSTQKTFVHRSHSAIRNTNSSSSPVIVLLSMISQSFSLSVDYSAFDTVTDAFLCDIIIVCTFWIVELKWKNQVIDSRYAVWWWWYIVEERKGK